MTEKNRNQGKPTRPTVKKGSLNESGSTSRKDSNVQQAFTGGQVISKGGKGSGDKK